MNYLWNIKSKRFPALSRKAFLFVCMLFLCSSIFSASKKNSKTDASSSQSADSEKTVITILHALKSTNVKDKETDEDLIIFEGSVKISVEKGSSKTIINADEISYNRKREMLYAAGNVQLEQTDKSGSVSNISATTVLFNTSSLEGIFDDGRIVQAETNALNMPSGSTLVVGSDVFARNHTGTIAFKKGELTFCNDKHPHWKIKASRIWLLPGNEFAFLNAVLFLDNIPVLYLPAFYYPKDELLFNPVFGYKNRLGFYVQTTTYAYGRKPLDTESSSAKDEDDDPSKYFNFIKPTKLMDQELEGIVLHNLDSVYTGDTSNYLKFMADWYSNLGMSIGFDGKYKPKKILTMLEGNVQLGFGNTIYTTTVPNLYLPFDSNGKKNYENSNFMGVEIPFRYKAGFKIGISDPVTLTLSMPIYSDPFFDYDYGDRSETMDWFSYLLNNPVAENSTSGKVTEDQKRDSSEISSFTWDLSGNYGFRLPDTIRPYIQTLAINNINSSIAFSSKTFSSEDNKPYELTDKPRRKFFFPSQITPIKISGTISGTIFSTAVKRPAKSFNQPTFPVDLITPEMLSLKEDEKDSNQDSDKNKDEDSSSFIFERDGLPVLTLSTPSTSTKVDDFAFNLNYNIAPDFGTQMTYSPESINAGREFNWDNIQSSYLYLKVPVGLNDNLSIKNDFISMKNSFSFNPSYQIHPYLSEDTAKGGYSKTNIDSIKQSDYSASLFDISNTNSLSLKPFAYYPVFKNTGITYNTAFKLYRTKFIGDADNPEWDKLTVDFADPDSFTTHSLDFTLSASELGGDFSQSLVFTSTLPPQVAKHYGTLRFAFPFVTLTGEAGVRQKSIDDKTWVKEQIRQGLSVSLFDSKLTFSESYNYDAEENRSDAFKLSMSYAGLQLGYTMKYSEIYDFDESAGWKTKNEYKFVPYSASLAYSSGSKKFYFWKNRISIAPTLSTSLVVDFIRPTNSYFIFTPGLTFRINEILDISFSATSRNDVLYRYVQNSLGYPGRIPGEENIFTDLINSFRFDDENLRKGSGFKLKSLNFSIVHDLHDWDLKCDFKIEPRLITPTTGQKYYDFSPYFSISVVWRPMESLKTEILDEYGTWQLK